MGTNPKRSPNLGLRYQHHPLEKKRAIVEESLKPGASVARIARTHGVNANQIFLWRKAWREGRLGEGSAKLLPVIVDRQETDRNPDGTRDGNRLTLCIGSWRLQIEGRPDPEVLRLVITELARA